MYRFRCSVVGRIKLDKCTVRILVDTTASEYITFDQNIFIMS